MIIKTESCELSPATISLSITLLLNGGSKALLIIKILSILAAMSCSNLSPPKPAPLVFGAFLDM